MTEAKITLTAVDSTKAGFASVLGGLDKVKASAASVATTFQRIAGPVSAAVLAIGGATAGLTASVAKALETGDQLFKLSQKVGISVETLSELRFAAELSGVSIETLQKGIKDLSVVLVQANDASSKEAQLLKTLGVTARDPEKALRQLADAFARLPDGTTKTAIAVDLLKKSGQEMIPFLNGGSAALDAMGFSARRLGLVISTDAARASETFNDNLLKLRTGAEALGISLTSKLIGTMANVTTQLVKAKEEGRVFEEVIDNMRRSVLRLFADVAKGDPNFLRNLVTGASQAEKAADIARRTSSGKIRGREVEQADPDTEARLQCTLSGGTWDAKSKRCIPKASASGPKPLSFDDLLLRNAERRQKQIDETEERDGAAAEKTQQEQLDLEAAVSLARLRRYEDEQRAADDVIARNREAARSIVDLADPTAQYVRQLEEVRRLVGEGFLTADQGLEAEFAIQGLIDRVLGLGGAAKETKDIATELGMTFSSALEDAIVKGGELSDVLKGLSQDVARLILRESITKPLAGGITELVKSSGVGSGIGSIFKNLFGFAEGGSFTVGGGGGTDSQVVAFRATPGERVSVETPGQQRGGGITVINQYVNLAAEIRQQIAMATPSIVSAAVSQVSDLRRRGVPV